MTTARYEDWVHLQDIRQHAATSRYGSDPEFVYLEFYAPDIAYAYSRIRRRGQVGWNDDLVIIVPLGMPGVGATCMGMKVIEGDTDGARFLIGIRPRITRQVETL